MKHLLLSLALLFICDLSAQNTMGVLTYDDELADPGYNLFFSHNQSTVYLIDACGEKVHSWTDEDDFRPGNAVYLLPNSNLVKCKRNKSSGISDPIFAGGAGETIELLTWDNDLISSITLNDSTYRLHHDVAPMPNGNILAIAWNSISREEAFAAGRKTSTLSTDYLWTLAILEWDPFNNEIVWEWNALDHVVQDNDPELDNYDIDLTNPHKIDINYHLITNSDWLHANAIDYNPVLDQIVVSIPHFDELWVIDHSTTSEEVKTSKGGNSGMGGDLLYRWGNPITYQKGDEDDRKLFFQHDVHWIDPLAEDGDGDFGKLMLFNNRLPGGLSSINILQTPVQGFNYSLGESGKFGPGFFTKTYIHPDTNLMAFSGSVSSAQLLPNENVLAFSGRWGFAYEITPDDEIAWEYRVPISVGQLATQGETIGIGDNLTFRMTRYVPDFPAFAGKDLSPKGYLEMDSDEDYCLQLTSSTEYSSRDESSLQLYPNPAFEMLHIKLNENSFSNSRYGVYNLVGELIGSGHLRNGAALHNVSALPQGSYIIKAGSSSRFFIKS